MKAGVPHIPDLPEPWKSRDKREANAINLPLREGTDKMKQLAAAYAAANTAGDLSAADFQSISLPPMIWSDDLLERPICWIKYIIQDPPSPLKHLISKFSLELPRNGV